MADISLFGLGPAGKALVEKVSNAFGRHFDPSQTVRMAEAEAKAHHILELNRAETEIAVAELRRRAAARIINEEMTKQENIESITAKAAQQVNDDARPEDVEDDWITNFFDKSRIVSDEDMQQLWASILAGEANNPGSFARKTVNLMGDINKHDAELFRNLCGYAWDLDNEPEPLVYDTNDEIYNQNDINFVSLSDLEALGLIHFNGANDFQIIVNRDRFAFVYNGIAVPLPFKGRRLTYGKVKFTRAGSELYRICQPDQVPGFFEYVYDRWASESLVSPRAT